MKQIAVWKVLLLTLITFGMYAIFWLARNRNYLQKQKSKKYRLPRWPWLLVTPIAIGFIFFNIITMYIIGSLGVISAEVASISILLTSLLAEVVVLGIGLWWLWHFGKAFEKVTQGRMSTVVTTVLYLFTGFFVIVFQQYYINRLDQNKKGETYNASAGFLVLVGICSAFGLLVSAASVYSTVNDTQSIKNDILTSQQELKAADKDMQHFEALRQKVDRLDNEYRTCINDLDATYPDEEIQPEQQAAYEEAYDACDAIYKDYEAAYDEFMKQ